MPAKKFSLEEAVYLVLFSLLWLFLGYWLMTNFFAFTDSWIPVLFLLLPYLIIVSKVWDVSIKAGTSGVEITPVAEKVAKAETITTIATKLGGTPSKRDQLLEIFTKENLESISEEDWGKIRGITEYIAIYYLSPISRVLKISDLVGYEYFPVIDNDHRRELKGVVTSSKIRDFLAKNPDYRDSNIEIILTALENEPAMRAYMNEPSEHVLERMLKNNLTRLPVVNDRNQLQGVISLKNLSKTKK
jgi:CBS domain-containing protein